MAEEMTNQSAEAEASEPEVMTFDDETPTTDAPKEEPKPEEPAPEDKTEPEPFLDIKYNGTEEHLTKEQAIELAQKGRNYDKINQRYQAQEPVMKVIQEQADRANLSLEEYVNRLSEFQKQSDINQIANDYKSQHPDADDETVNAYAEAAYENSLNEQAVAAQMEEQQALAAREQSAKEQLQAFLNEYPDVDVMNLPDEVKADIDQGGMTLLDAYRAYDLKLTKAALAAERKNAQNRSVSVGNVTDNTGKTGETDPFLQGLLG